MGAGAFVFGEQLPNDAEIGKKLAGPLYVCRSARFCWCGQICRSCGVEREILEKRSAENALTTPDQNRSVVFFGRLRIAREPSRLGQKDRRTFIGGVLLRFRWRGQICVSCSSD